MKKIIIAIIKIKIKSTYLIIKIIKKILTLINLSKYKRKKKKKTQIMEIKILINTIKLSRNLNNIKETLVLIRSLLKIAFNNNSLEKFLWIDIKILLIMELLLTNKILIPLIIMEEITPNLNLCLFI